MSLSRLGEVGIWRDADPITERRWTSGAFDAVAVVVAVAVVMGEMFDIAVTTTAVGAGTGTVAGAVAGLGVGARFSAAVGRGDVSGLTTDAGVVVETDMIDGDGLLAFNGTSRGSAVTALD